MDELKLGLAEYDSEVGLLLVELDTDGDLLLVYELDVARLDENEDEEDGRLEELDDDPAHAACATSTVKTAPARIRILGITVN